MDVAGYGALPPKKAQNSSVSWPSLTCTTVRPPERNGMEEREKRRDGGEEEEREKRKGRRGQWMSRVMEELTRGKIVRYGLSAHTAGGRQEYSCLDVDAV